MDVSVAVNEVTVYCKGFLRGGTWCKGESHIDSFVVAGRAERRTMRKGYRLCPSCRDLWDKTAKLERETNRRLAKREGELIAFLKEKVNPKTSKERAPEVETKINQIGLDIQKETGMSKDTWNSYRMSLEKSINYI